MSVNKQYEFENKVQYHIRCMPGDIGKYVLLPGDPARIDLIAKLLDNVREVAYNREHRTITGFYQGLKVSATSTGMGCPSTAIAVEELIQIGAKVLVRVGSTAGLADEVQEGDYILPTGAVPLDGTSKLYLENDPFSAVPDFDVVHALYHSAQESKKRIHTGLVLVHDAFYAETEEFIKRWYRRNILTVEMESSILYVIGTLRKVKTASFHLAGGNLITKRHIQRTNVEIDEARFYQHKIVLDAFKHLEESGSI